MIVSAGYRLLLGTSVSFYKTSATMSKKSVSPSGEQTIAVTVSFGKPYACSICLIFSLFMESNALGKFTKKKYVAWRFFCWLFFRWFNEWLESENLWINFSENHSGLPFLYFRSDTFEKQGLMNFSNYDSQDYTPIVHKDSAVTFLRMGAFRSFLCYVLITDWVA